MHRVLKAEHDRMRAMLAELEALLAREVPPVDDRLSQLRWALAREHLLHSRREGVFFARAFGAVAAAAHGRVAGVLDDQVTRQVKDWDGVGIAHHWDRYRTATRAMIRRLRWQMDEEDRTLATLTPAP